MNVPLRHDEPLDVVLSRESWWRLWRMLGDMRLGTMVIEDGKPDSIVFSRGAVLGDDVSITHPDELADAFRSRQNELGLSNAWIDEAGGFGDEQINKYLGPTRTKQIGPWYFQMLCSLLAVKFVMVVDEAQVEKIQKQWEQRKPQYVQPLSRAPSKKLLERAAPHVLKDLSERGNEARRTKLPGKHRSDIARRAADAMWKKRGRKKTKGHKRRRARHRARVRGFEAR